MKFSRVLTAAIGRVVLVVQMAAAAYPWIVFLGPTCVRANTSIAPNIGVAVGVVSHSVKEPYRRTEFR